VQVAVWVGAPSRSPPTTHQELVGVFSYRQFTKPLRFADTHLGGNKQRRSWDYSLPNKLQPDE
jgi:hypothetical protein